MAKRSRFATRSAKSSTVRTGCRNMAEWRVPTPSQNIDVRSSTPRRHAMEFADRASFYWGNLTWEELKAARERKPVVIQPIGATEQHGFHLPLNTDNFIVTKLCDAAGRLAPDEL